MLLGALGGMSLGLVYVGALMLVSKRERRGDYLFGAWFGMAAGAVLLVIIAIGLNAADARSTAAAALNGTEVRGIVSDCLKDDVSACRRPSGPFYFQCDEPRYAALDREWVVDCGFSDERGGVVTGTTTYLVSDITAQMCPRAVRLVGQPRCIGPTLLTKGRDKSIETVSD